MRSLMSFMHKKCKLKSYWNKKLLSIGMIWGLRCLGRNNLRPWLLINRLLIKKVCICIAMPVVVAHHKLAVMWKSNQFHSTRAKENDQRNTLTTNHTKRCTATSSITVGHRSYAPQNTMSPCRFCIFGYLQISYWQATAEFLPLVHEVFDKTKMTI